MADPFTASIVQAGLKSAGNFLKDELIKRIFGSIFGGGGSDLPPLTPEQQAALEVSNALNMAQGDLYGDGQNEGFLETVGPTFEEAVRKVQSLDDSEEKTDLLSVLANNAPYDFTDLTPASITNLEEDDLSNPLLAPNPLLVEQAANTGPFVTDSAAGTDTLVASGDSDKIADDKETGATSETAEQILAKYKDRADPVTDMLGDYKQEDGSIFPVNVLLEIISDYAINRNNKDAQIVLGKWNDKVAARKEDILDADAAANNQAAAEAAAARNQAGADAAAQQTSDGNTDTGLKADNAAGGVGGAGNVPASGADTTVGGAGNDTLTGGNGDDTINNDNDTDKDISVISGGSVLDQTGTANVNVDDKPAGLLNIPTSIPKQPERKAGMIMQISQSAPIVETVFDDILFEPKFTRLDNIPDFNLPSGLLRTLV